MCACGWGYTNLQILSMSSKFARSFYLYIHFMYDYTPYVDRIYVLINFMWMEGQPCASVSLSDIIIPVPYCIGDTKIIIDCDSLLSATYCRGPVT